MSTLISAVVGFGSALLAILITPPLQHYFWKRQRYAELQLKVADELNDIAAYFYMVHTSSDIATYELTKPFLTQILIVQGKVKALFSNEAFKRFEVMEILIAATGSPSEGLGAEGKIGAPRNSRESRPGCANPLSGSHRQKLSKSRKGRRTIAGLMPNDR